MLIVVNDADSCFCAESSTVSSPDTESATSAVTPADKVKNQSLSYRMFHFQQVLGNGV